MTDHKTHRRNGNLGNAPTKWASVPLGISEMPNCRTSRPWRSKVCLTICSTRSGGKTHLIRMGVRTIRHVAFLGHDCLESAVR
jgi:hypothetical protein